MTTPQLLEYFYDQLLEGLGEENKEDMVKLSRVYDAVDMVYDAAEHHNDMKVMTICDELQYVVAHAKLARFKSEAQMLVIKELIEDLDKP